MVLQRRVTLIYLAQEALTRWGWLFQERSQEKWISSRRSFSTLFTVSFLKIKTGGFTWHLWSGNKKFLCFRCIKVDYSCVRPLFHFIKIHKGRLVHKGRSSSFGMAECVVVSSLKWCRRLARLSLMSFMFIRKIVGQKTLPRGTPAFTN